MSYALVAYVSVSLGACIGILVAGICSASGDP